MLNPYELIQLIAGVLIFLIGILALVRISSFLEKLSRRSTSAREFKESVREGATEEPRPVRDLSEIERSKLSDYLYSHRGVIDSPRTWVFVYLISFIVLTYMLSGSNGGFNTYLSEGRYVYAAIISAVVLFVMVIKARISEARAYSDLKLPVMRVQGSFIKRYQKYEDKDKKQLLVAFVVRGIEFSVINDLAQIASQLRKGDEVEVEYSPYTKKVWLIKKVVES